MNILLELLYCLMYVSSLAYCILKIQNITYTYKSVLRIICLCLIYAVINYFITNTNALHGNWFILSNIICIFSDFIFACILLKKIKVQHLFYTSLYYVIFSCFVSLYITSFIYFFDNQYLDAIYNNIVRFLITLLSNSTAIFTYLMISKTYAFLDFNIPRKQYYIFVFSNTLSIILLLTFSILLLNESSPYFLAVCILVLSQIFITNYFINSICIMYKKSNKLELAQYANKISLKHLKDLEVENTRINKFKHDTNNHLAILNELIEVNTPAADYLNKMQDKFKSNLLIRSGNFYVDACINAKIRLFPEINFDISAIVSKDINIQEDDLCSLLFNLIDNAVEATKNTKDNNVCIKITSIKQMLLIKISNPNIGDLTFETEKGKGHGQGMTIIKEIIKKYNGTIDYSYINNVVYCSVQLDC